MPEKWIHDVNRNCNWSTNNNCINYPICDESSSSSSLDGNLFVHRSFGVRMKWIAFNNPSLRGGEQRKAYCRQPEVDRERAKKWSSSIVRGFRQSIIASRSLFNGIGCERCTRVLQGVLSSFTRVICSLIQFSNFPPTSEISSDFHGWNGNERSVFISGTPPLCR